MPGLDEPDQPDLTTEAYLMPMKRLAEVLRDLGARSTRPGDAARRAVLLEAASRLDSKYAYRSAIQRDDNRIRGLDAFGNEIDNREDEAPEEEP